MAISKIIGSGLGTINSPVEFTSADNLTQITLSSTDADANSGPNLDFYRNSGSPADNDLLAKITIQGKNDAGQQVLYSFIDTYAHDITDGTEDGGFYIYRMMGGSSVESLSFTTTEAVFNESSADYDFRVESNGRTDMFFVNGGTNNIGIAAQGGDPTVALPGVVNIGGTMDANTGKQALSVTGAKDSYSSNALWQNQIAIFDSTAQAARNGGAISFMGNLSDTAGASPTWAATIEAEKLNATANNYSFNFNIRTRNNNDAAMYTRIVAGSVGVGFGGVGVNGVESSRTSVSGNGESGVFIADSGELTAAHYQGAAIFANRLNNDGSVISIRQNGTQEGTISVSGSTVSYNAFSASHWGRLTDNSKPTILKGTLIETIDEMMEWHKIEYVNKAEVQWTSGDDIPDGKNVGDVKSVEEKRTVSIALPDGKSVGDTITHEHTHPDKSVTSHDCEILQELDNKHTKVKISTTADSTRIYGVFATWDNDDDNVNDMYVTAVGTHVVRIHKDQTVAAGDLLVSNGDGTAKVQDDDIIRSKTLGKVLTNIKQETYADDSYVVPCALYCG